MENHKTSPLTNSIDGKSMVMKPSYESNKAMNKEKMNKLKPIKSNANIIKESRSNTPKKIVDIPSPVLKNKRSSRSRTKLPNSIVKLLRARNKQLFVIGDDKNPTYNTS